MTRRVIAILSVGLLAAGCTPLDSEPEDARSSRASSASPTPSAEPTPEPTATSTGALERPASLPKDAEWYEGDGFGMYIGADWAFDGTYWRIGEPGDPSSIVINVTTQSVGPGAEPGNFMDEMEDFMAEFMPGVTLVDQTTWVVDDRTYGVFDYLGQPEGLTQEVGIFQALLIADDSVLIATMVASPQGWAKKRRAYAPYFRTLVAR